MGIPVEAIRCPVHGIPDCSPLLNGCSIPSRLAAAFKAGSAAALKSAADDLPSSWWGLGVDDWLVLRSLDAER